MKVNGLNLGLPFKIFSTLRMFLLLSNIQFITEEYGSKLQGFLSFIFFRKNFLNGNRKWISQQFYLGSKTKIIIFTMSYKSEMLL